MQIDKFTMKYKIIFFLDFKQYVSLIIYLNSYAIAFFFSNCSFKPYFVIFYCLWPMHNHIFWDKYKIKPKCKWITNSSYMWNIIISIISLFAFINILYIDIKHSKLMLYLTNRIYISIFFTVYVQPYYCW